MIVSAASRLARLQLPNPHSDTSWLLSCPLFIVLQIRDPRVDIADNDQFIDILESYFMRSDEEKMAEARPHLAYQVSSEQ